MKCTSLSGKRHVLRSTRGHGSVGMSSLSFVLCIALTGCTFTLRHPFLQPDVREALRTGRPLAPETLAPEPPKKLEEVPPEPATTAVERAKEITAPTAATPTVQLDLATVRKNALEHNLDLQVSLYDPAIAEAGYQGERWKFEAILGFDSSYNSSRDMQGREARTVSLSPSVQVPTRLGGIASISLPYSRRDSDQLLPSGFGQPVEAGRTETVNVDLALSQPLLRGAGLEINYASINSAGLRMRQADARTKLFAMRTLANAEQFYWRYYAAYENLKIQLEQYDRALEQLRTARRLIEEGARTKIEELRAQSDLARRFDSIISAENTRRQAELGLKRVMNAPTLPITSPTAIIPTTPPNPLGFTFDRDKVVAMALQNRMELFENEVQLAIDRITLQVDRNFALPDVRFNFSYSFSGAKPRFDDALDVLFRKEFNTSTVGVTAEVPLAGNQRSRYRALQSALILSQTEANRRALELLIREEVLNAINAVELNWQRVLSNRVAVDRAQETYEANKREFQLGLITSTEFSLTLDQLATAQSAFVFSLSDFQTSMVDLAFATGTVLGQGGVIWTPAARVDSGGK